MRKTSSSYKCVSKSSDVDEMLFGGVDRRAHQNGPRKGEPHAQQLQHPEVESAPAKATFRKSSSSSAASAAAPVKESSSTATPKEAHRRQKQHKRHGGNTTTTSSASTSTTVTLTASELARLRAPVSILSREQVETARREKEALLEISHANATERKLRMLKMEEERAKTSGHPVIESETIRCVNDARSPRWCAYKARTY